MTKPKATISLDAQLDVISGQVKRVQDNLDDAKNQFDQDRTAIDQLKISLAKVEEAQDTITKNLGDFRANIKQTIEDTIKQEVAISVQKELNKIVEAKPKNVFIFYRSWWDSIKNWRNKK